LLPRIKQINRITLYRAAAAETDRQPALAPAMTRPIRWDLIADQYDQMIKYATAIRTGTAYQPPRRTRTSIACLRVLQAALVFVNTLMLQDVLAERTWAASLTDTDRRGLTPLFWTHLQPYGEVRLNMASRLALHG